MPYVADLKIINNGTHIKKQDVENLGFKDDVVQVKKRIWTKLFDSAGSSYFSGPSRPKKYWQKTQATRFQEQKLVDNANALGKVGFDIKIAAKAGGTGKLFGSINNADLSAALKDAGHEIEKSVSKLLVDL